MEAHALVRGTGGLALPRSRKLLAAFGDERLVEQVRRGNEVAFEVLYDRHHGGVLSYCRHMLGSRDEAEDALQQAFVAAHTDLVGSDKPIRFKAWIYTIARNRCLSVLRARREHPVEDLERVSTAGLGDEVQQREDLKQLLADMQELPEEQRAALVLSELGDLSHADVAGIIGCEAAKVKSLVFQARSGLIERRQARETPCEEIREQLATLRGGSLRRGPLRRHVKACPGCAEFRDEVRRQRQMVAAVLPVFPTLGLKESALAAIGIGGTGGGAAAAGGIGAVVVTKVGAAKVAVVAVTAGGAALGGGVAVEQAARDKAEPPAAVHSQPATGSKPVATLLTGAAVLPPAWPGARGGDGGSGEAGGPGPAKKKAEAKTNGGASKDAAGFTPTLAESNGDAARDFARGRGNGKKHGLDKHSAQGPRGHGNGNGNGSAPGRSKGKDTPPPGADRSPGATPRAPAQAFGPLSNATPGTRAKLKNLPSQLPELPRKDKGPKQERSAAPDRSAKGSATEKPNGQAGLDSVE